MIEVHIRFRPQPPIAVSVKEHAAFYIRKVGAGRVEEPPVEEQCVSRFHLRRQRIFRHQIVVTRKVNATGHVTPGDDVEIRASLFPRIRKEERDSISQRSIAALIRSTSSGESASSTTK